MNPSVATALRILLPSAHPQGKKKGSWGKNEMQVCRKLAMNSNFSLNNAPATFQVMYLPWGEKVIFLSSVLFSNRAGGESLGKRRW